MYGVYVLLGSLTIIVVIIPLQVFFEFLVCPGGWFHAVPNVHVGFIGIVLVLFITYCKLNIGIVSNFATVILTVGGIKLGPLNFEQNK